MSLDVRHIFKFVTPDDNQMLEDIQQRDAALQSAQLKLEQRVDERTEDVFKERLSPRGNLERKSRTRQRKRQTTRCQDHCR